MKRSSGIIMPLYSLPSPYGIGTMGKAAYDFIDFLKESGQKYWQLLPLGPTDLGDSPYSSPSTFAGNPFLIDLDMLIDDGLLDENDVLSIDWGSDLENVDYDLIKENRISVLRKAFNIGRNREQEKQKAFYDENRRWLDSYALFMALLTEYKTSWTKWPEDIRRRNANAVEKYRNEYQDDVDFWIFTQYVFYKQWNELREYARKSGISFIGDIPIYVAMNSADLWSEPWFFQIDKDGIPAQVSGCPSDDYNDDGQLWGNPLYNYDAMKNDGYGWWIRRIEGATKLYDVVRIDHFRGFESYWAVPYGAESAKEGHWEKGPGMSLVGVLTSWFNNMEYIAEDLGLITPEVRQLLDESKIPGMRVLQFAFDANTSSSYLPHCCPYNSCCYVGTHDNNTTLGWVETMPDEDREFARRYMHITDDEGWAWGTIRTGMATSSNLFAVQMQDVLELPGKCRTNVPGVAQGNWRWRMKPDALSEELAKKLLKYTQTYRRTDS